MNKDLEIIKDMVRLLGTIVPEDATAMKRWVCDSEDSLRTYAGVAHRIGYNYLKTLDK